jgi:hypothetical protein
MLGHLPRKHNSLLPPFLTYNPLHLTDYSVSTRGLSSPPTNPVLAASQSSVQSFSVISSHKNGQKSSRGKQAEISSAIMISVCIHMHNCAYILTQTYLWSRLVRVGPRRLCTLPCVLQILSNPGQSAIFFFSILIHAPA